MLLIGETHCYIDTDYLSASRLKGYAEALFDDFDNSVSRTLILRDYELHLEVEEGSIRAKTGIWAALGVLYVGIGNYGDFFQGVREISSQVKAVGDSFLNSAPEKLGVTPNKVTWKRRDSARLGKLERLFESVARGEVNPAQATKQAIELLEDDHESFPSEIATEVEKSINAIKRYPEQLLLSLPDASNADASPMAYQDDTRRNDKRPKSTPDKSILPSNKLRIEVWREGRDGKRNIRVIEF